MHMHVSLISLKRLFKLAYSIYKCSHLVCEGHHLFPFFRHTAVNHTHTIGISGDNN